MSTGARGTTGEWIAALAIGDDGKIVVAACGRHVVACAGVGLPSTPPMSGGTVVFVSDDPVDGILIAPTGDVLVACYGGVAVLRGAEVRERVVVAAADAAAAAAAAGASAAGAAAAAAAGAAAAAAAGAGAAAASRGGSAGLVPLCKLEYLGWPLATAVSPDGRWVAAGCNDSSVHLWDTSGKKVRWGGFGGGGELPPPVNPRRLICRWPRSGVFATPSPIPTQRAPQSTPADGLSCSGYEKTPDALSWDDRGRFLATGGGAGATVWRFQTSAGVPTSPAGKLPILCEPLSDDGTVTALAFQPDSGLLATGTTAGSVTLVDVAAADAPAASGGARGGGAARSKAGRRKNDRNGPPHASVVAIGKPPFHVAGGAGRGTGAGAGPDTIHPRLAAVAGLAWCSSAGHLLVGYRSGHLALFKSTA